MENTNSKVERTLTFGEKRVRISFNPSEDNLVDVIKAKSAELIDLLDRVRNSEASNTYEASIDVMKERSGEKFRLIALAQTAYEEAAMWAVKAVTI